MSAGMRRMIGRWPLAFRLARREMSQGLAGFGVFLVCLALGVAAVAAVGSTIESITAGIRRDAAVLLGGDLELRQTHMDLPADVLESARSKAVVSRAADMRSMVRLEGGDATLVELKAVDEAYPLYGEAALASGQGLHQALAPRDGVLAAVAQEGLLARLEIEPGGEVLLGQARFRITDVLAKEPDKASNFFGLGPRLMIRYQDLTATGMVQNGTLVNYHARLKVPEGKELAGLRADLERRAEESTFRVRGVEEASQGLAQSLNNLEVYLTLVGLASLLIAGLGVSAAVGRYLERRLKSIAVMKCLGMDRGLLLQAYGLQILFLALAGSLLGLLAGQAMAMAAGEFVRRTFDIPLSLGFYRMPLLMASGFGLLTAAAYSAPPLSAAAQASPTRLFRGYVDPQRGRPGKGAWLFSAVAGALLFLLALAGLGNWKAVTGFAAACGVSALLLYGLSRLIRLAAIRLSRVARVKYRHGLANIYRPGSATGRVVFSLGLGLTAMAAVILTQAAQEDQLDRRMPETAPSYFFLSIPKEGMAKLGEILDQSPGVERYESEPSLRGRIVNINGVPASEAQVSEDVQWALRGDRGMTFAAEKPADLIVTAGDWWPADYAGPPLICFDRNIAEGFGVGVGDTLTLGIMGRQITAEIACLREINWATLALNHSVIFAPGTVEAAPYGYIATAYVQPEHEADLGRRIAREMPQVVQVYVADVLADAARVFDHIALATKAAAGLTLLAGLLVLAEVLRTNLRSRYYDVVVLKVLGASRRDIMLSLLSELGFLGLATAVASGLLGSLLAYAFITQLLEMPWSFQPLPLAAILFIGLGSTLILGLAGVRRLLGHSAWGVLRNE